MQVVHCGILILINASAFFDRFVAQQQSTVLAAAYSGNRIHPPGSAGIPGLRDSAGCARRRDEIDKLRCLPVFSARCCPGLALPARRALSIPGRRRRRPEEMAYHVAVHPDYPFPSTGRVLLEHCTRSALQATKGSHDIYCACRAVWHSHSSSRRHGF